MHASVVSAMSEGRGAISPRTGDLGRDADILISEELNRLQAAELFSVVNSSRPACSPRLRRHVAGRTGTAAGRHSGTPRGGHEGAAQRLGAPVADPLGGLGNRVARLQRRLGAVETHRLDVPGRADAELIVEQPGEVARTERGQRRQPRCRMIARRVRSHSVEHRPQRRRPRARAAQSGRDPSACALRVWAHRCSSTPMTRTPARRPGPAVSSTSLEQRVGVGREAGGSSRPGRALTPAPDAGPPPRRRERVGPWSTSWSSPPTPTTRTLPGRAPPGSARSRRG